MDTNDGKLIWKSINWKGSVECNDAENPDDEQFKEHFEKLLNPPDVENLDNDVPESAPYIPILDDPFTPSELDQALCNMNTNKSYSGLCPGVVKNLPVLWLSFLLSIFNAVFNSWCYPLAWCCSKLVVLFKSGNRLLCNNYRGISIMDTLAKIYDTMIQNRLKLWCDIDKC